MTALELESIARPLLRLRGRMHTHPRHADHVSYYFSDGAICIERVVHTVDAVVQDELTVSLERDGGHVGAYDIPALKIRNGRVIVYDVELADEAAKYLMRVMPLDILAGQQFDGERPDGAGC